MLLWGLAGLGVLLAVAAYVAVRRVSRKLDALTQSYWELRYDYTRLRAQVASLDPAAGADAETPPAAAPAGQTVTFVPLSTMRKKDT